MNQDKVTLIKQFDSLTNEEIKILFRFFTLQTREKTLKEMDRPSASMFGQDVTSLVDVFMKKLSGDPEEAFLDNSKNFIIKQWIDENRKELDEIADKVERILAKILTAEFYDLVVRMDTEKSNKEEKEDE